MTRIPALRATAIAALLVLAGAAQAQEATAWEVQGPPLGLEARASRSQVMADVVAARSRGWRPAGEVSRFDAEESSSPLRMARATHTRAAVVAEMREARRAGLLEGDDGEAGASDRALARRHAFNESERERILAQFEADRQEQLAAAPLQPEVRGGTLSSGTEAAAAAPVQVAADARGGAAPAEQSNHRPGDQPQAPLAPSSDAAITAPVRPEPGAEGRPAAGSGDADAQPGAEGSGDPAAEPATGAVSSPVTLPAATLPADTTPAVTPPADTTPATTAADPGAAGTAPTVAPLDPRILPPVTQDERGVATPSALPPAEPAPTAQPGTTAGDGAAAQDGTATTQAVEPPTPLQSSDLPPR